MDLATLAVFRAVAKEQSITRAAELLGRVPSNVTTRIQQLEAEIGIALFVRETRKMELTEEGATYLDYADRILNLADEAQQVVNPVEPTGTLRIGSMEASAATRLPDPLAAFNAKWPQVAIDLTTSPTRQLIEALTARRIDCALVALPSGEGWDAHPDLDTVALFREELVLLLPPGHPEVEGPGQIRPRSLAAFAAGCSYRAVAQEWVSGLASRTSQINVQEVRSYHTMVACTAAGSCFSILPRRVLQQVPEAERFTVKPIATVDTFLASRAGFRTPAFIEFRDTLQAFSDIGGDLDAR